MIKFFKLLFFVFALFITEAKAYEFKKINHLFDSIENEFISKPNFRTISMAGLDILNEIDKDIKIFYNKNRAFLYAKNNLVMNFDLPQTKDCLSWKNLINEILNISMKHSNKLLNHKEEIELKILDVCSQNVDKYSRITKEDANITTSYFEYNVENNVLYVKSMDFFDGFAFLLKDIITNNPSIDGLVLDLRQNRGGNFNEALKTADLFLDEALITYATLKNNSKKYYTSTSGDILNGKKIVILTSEQTASSAEIVTAALSEQGRATTIGTKTYGKGSVQNAYNFDNSFLYITNALVYSPAGNLIEDNGINPHICTGVENSCLISNKKNPNKDILMAINMIKNTIG